SIPVRAMRELRFCGRRSQQRSQTWIASNLPRSTLRAIRRDDTRLAATLRARTRSEPTCRDRTYIRVRRI
ncbi:MAG: hypothetical protein ACK5XN_36900, partial [Bacteroidota bacterium]